MNIKFMNSYCMSVLVCISILLSTGCTHVYKQPIHEINLASTEEKIDLSVKLILTDDFRNAKWEKKSLGDTWILPVGDNLVHSTKELVRNVFVQPLIPDEATNLQNNTIEARYLLEPKVVLIEQSFGVWVASDASTTIGVEWTLSHLNGNKVWVETVKGVAIGKQGNIATGKRLQTTRFKLALQDLFEKSQEAFISSPLLKKLP